MSVRATAVVLVMLLALLAAYFIPLSVALSLRLSGFDLMMGALSGGNWSPSRCFLVAAFVAILLAIVWCITRLVARHRS